MLTRPPAAKLDKREKRRLAQQRYRQHVADSVRIAPVVVGELLLSYLIDGLHQLDADDAGDRKKVGEAITKVLLESATAWANGKR